MLPPFDIFKSDPQGGLQWVGAAQSLIAARQSVVARMSESPGEYVVLSHHTGNRIVFKEDNISASHKRKVLQIYDEGLMWKRHALLTSRGHTVTSVFGNDAGKAALNRSAQYDLVLIGHNAPKNVRNEMSDWIKTNYPHMMILALNPPTQPELMGADFNLLLNGPEEWLLIAETASN